MQSIGFRNQPAGARCLSNWVEVSFVDTRSDQGEGRMKMIRKLILLVGVTLVVALLSFGVAAKPAPQGYSRPIEKQVRHELVTLPYYGVFDNLAFSVNGNTVSLYGQVVRPTTRSDAERRIKRIPGVARVVNNIKVLPLSRMDDNIRSATYRSIARSGGLYRYLQGTNPSLHIVVDRGRVSLEGVVDAHGDRTLAYMAANQVPGVFSVTNNLRVNGESELR